jgi:tripartite-type tricarboxylate transporter receptor subunit TctC
MIKTLKLTRQPLAVCGGILAVTIAIAAPSLSAAADEYPTRPITVINPWTAGGPADTVARPVLQKLSELLKQPVVLENKAGANGTIGASFVAQAKPDGYTLLFSHVGPITISPALMKRIPYDSVRDLAPITQIVSAPTVLVVRPDLPVHNMKELIDYARAHPGELTYGSVGPGSTTHLAGEILANMADVKLLHVPYKGAAPVVTDLLGKQIDMAFLNIAGVVPLLKAEKVRGIGVSTLNRSTLLPDMPAIAETYPGFEVNSWYGLMAPAGTPKAVIDRLQQDVSTILKMPDMVETLETSGLAPEGTTPDQYAQQIDKDLARWKEVVDKAGLEPQ